jgi:AcrR family transcriptional regulator
MSESLGRAGRVLLELALERPWPEVTLRAVADRAGLPLADLYKEAPSRAALIDHLACGYDLAAMGRSSPEGEAHDRLFDAVMARLEVMAPDREAVLAVIRGEGPVSLAPQLPRTARAILESAGIPATPPRLAAMTAVWARVLQVWRDDEGALNRTMAEVDLRLKSMRRRLGWLGQGF